MTPVSSSLVVTPFNFYDNARPGNSGQLIKQLFGESP